MDKVTPNPITTTGAQGFLEWLKRYQPRLYAQIKSKVPKTMSGFGLVADGEAASAATTTTATPSWLATVQNLITAAGQAWLTKEQIDAQKDLLKIQLQRAQAGMAPLDIDPTKYGLPGASVSVGLSSDTKNMLLYGGLGLAAVLLLMGRKRRAA